MQKKLSEDVGFRVSAAGNEPDFRTISDFRKLHLGALRGLFDQVLQIALQAGTKLGRVVLDGSKVKANASNNLGITKLSCRGISAVLYLAKAARLV